MSGSMLVDIGKLAQRVGKKIPLHPYGEGFYIIV
jgi:hypothetical protein